MRYPTRPAIDKFNMLLGLKEEPYMQDWEIECADPEKVDEYIECYKQHAITEEEKFTLMALILGAFEEYHGGGVPSEALWKKINSILINDLSVHKDHIEYYACAETDNEDEWFPITKLIRPLRKEVSG